MFILSIPYKVLGTLTYNKRAQQTVNPFSKKLFTIMETKKSNVIASIDVTSKEQLLTLVDQIGPYICALKTHVDIIEDFDTDLIERLQQLAHQHNFLIIEDRKFADTGNTVLLQYTKGLYKIVEWADIVIIHALPGEDIVKALLEGAHGRERAALIIAQLSSSNNLIDEVYTQKVVDIARKYPQFIMGFIAQNALGDSSFITCIPGVHITQNNDHLGQQWNSPTHVIEMQKGDAIIVGRGIYQAANPVQAVQQYQQAGWQSYLRRISQ